MRKVKEKKEGRIRELGKGKRYSQKKKIKIKVNKNLNFLKWYMKIYKLFTTTCPYYMTFV